MFDRLIMNWQLAMSSVKVLLYNKRLLIFPVLSSIASILVFLGFFAPFLFIPEAFVNEQPNGQVGFAPPWWMTIVTFVYYFVCFFITIFFNTALMSCAFIHFNGGKPTLEDGLRCAIARLPSSDLWSRPWRGWEERGRGCFVVRVCSVEPRWCWRSSRRGRRLSGWGWRCFW